MRIFHFLVISLALEPKDCLVSEWSGWAGCSKTCGIGETVRGFTLQISTTMFYCDNR